MEFVPVDAGAEGRLAGVQFVFLEDAVGVRVGAAHVAVSFAGAA